MKFSLLLLPFAVMLLITGCAQKVKIKALNPAEVGQMAEKKKIAITSFKNDKVGLSGKIESSIAKHKLDKQRYFTVLSRKDLNKVMAEQKLQSSELMDEKTASKIGNLLGAQALINGEISDAQAESTTYKVDREKCLSYYKNGGCAKWRYYKDTCRTTQATVSANINIVNMETGSLLYGDTFVENYSADTCKHSNVLSKQQALGYLAGRIANKFVYKLTPQYVYFQVTLLEDIELENVTEKDEDSLKYALEYIKAGRMAKADTIITKIMDNTNGQSYVVSYDLGVVKEAQGQFAEAKKLYALADSLTMEPNDEINAAILRIEAILEKQEEAKQQMNAK
ncbi:MAG: CsgG/HfaB family protein [Campylobacterota bacterium]|nr:CsgG/HfaB family protein [Campylobacterota bacterium]